MFCQSSTSTPCELDAQKGDTHRRLHHRATRELPRIAMLSHPVELDVDGLLLLLFAEDTRRHHLSHMFGQRHEYVDGCDVEDLCGTEDSDTL